MAEPELRFTTVMPRREVTVAGVAVGSVTVTAVAADATATAVLSLLGVPASAAVTVELSTADARTARVMPESVMFSAATTSREVTVTGVSAGNATVTAVAVLLDGLSESSTVTSAELALTVVLPTVELQLAFEPPTLTVAAGSRETAVLSLSGVPTGAEVTVRVSAANVTTAQLVTEPELPFTAMMPRHEVTIVGVGAGNTTVMAEPVSLDGLSVDSTVADADLLVTVVEAPGLRLRVRVLLEGPLQ